MQVTEKGSNKTTVVPELKGRMPTSLSQEADGQLKNKNIVSIGHSKGKNCSHLCSCNIKCLKKIIPNTKTTHKPTKLTEGRNTLPRSYDLMVVRILMGLFRMLLMGQRGQVLPWDQVCPGGGGHLRLGSTSSCISSIKNMTAKQEDSSIRPWVWTKFSVLLYFLFSFN